MNVDPANKSDRKSIVDNRQGINGNVPDSPPSDGVSAPPRTLKSSGMKPLSTFQGGAANIRAGQGAVPVWKVNPAITQAAGSTISQSPQQSIPIERSRTNVHDVAVGVSPASSKRDPENSARGLGMQCAFHSNTPVSGTCSKCNRSLCTSCLNEWSPPMCRFCAKSYCLTKISEAKISLYILGAGALIGLIIGMTNSGKLPPVAGPLFITLAVPMGMCGIWMFFKYTFGMHLSLIYIILFGLPAVAILIFTIIFLSFISIVVLPVIIYVNIKNMGKYERWLQKINHAG